MQVTIREARLADICAIQAVAAESWRATYGDIYSQDYIDRFLASAYSADALRHAIASDRGLFLVAKDNGATVGFCQLGEGQNRGRRDLVLYRLYVAPTHWRHGIGGSLLAVAEDWLKRRGADGYHCFVHSQNEVGKGFYRKAGFVHDPAHDKEDEWFMWKEVPA